MRVNIHWMDVVVTTSALKEYAKLPRPIQTRMLHLVERLGRWPNVSGAKPLSGQLAGHFRLRTGDYRLQFRLEGAYLVVERIGHRDGFYDE
jgi:mRNA-degrading endonuclease RelE of RelBE toxin-antitoxin system